MHLGRPETAWTPGTYRATIDRRCSPNAPPGEGDLLTTTFEVISDVPVPKELGSLSASPPVSTRLAIATRRGSCSELAAVEYVDIEIQMASEFEPFADVALYQTLIDGEPWEGLEAINDRLPVGSTWQGRGRDRVFVDCHKEQWLVANQGRGAGRRRETAVGGRLARVDCRQSRDVVQGRRPCIAPPFAAS